MRCYMEDGKEKHSIGDLTMEPLRFIERQPPSLRTEPTKDVSAHRHDDDHCIDTQNQTGTSRYPY
jgi:hypothetical protein